MYYKFHNIYKYVDKHITLHTWNCSSQFLAGPPTFPRWCGWSGPATSTRCTGAKRASRSSSHVRGTTGGLQLDRRVVGQASRRRPAGSEPSPRRGGGTCASLASIRLRARTGATCRAETSSSHLRRRQHHPRQGGRKREDRPHVT